MRTFRALHLLHTTLLLGLLLAVSACGGSDSTAPVTHTGNVVFRIDAFSCTGSGNIQLIVDGAVVGTETLAAGQSSQTYKVNEGQHIFSAKETASPGFVWPSQSLFVQANQNLTVILTC